MGVSEREERLAATVRAWQGKRILVLGDVVADELVVGVPQEIAREAPVLVLRHAESSILPGGATNVAANAAALGAQVEVCGVVGDDETGRQLIQALQESGLGCAGVVVDPSRPTTTKTRIFAGGAQQLVQQLLLRLDRVDRRPVAGAVTDEMAAYLARTLPEIDALMISDYENGVIHPGLIAASLPAGDRPGAPGGGGLPRRPAALPRGAPLHPQPAGGGGHPGSPADSPLRSGERRAAPAHRAGRAGRPDHPRAGGDDPGGQGSRGDAPPGHAGRDGGRSHRRGGHGGRNVHPGGGRGGHAGRGGRAGQPGAAVVVARMGTATASADDLLAAIGAGIT